MVSRALLGIAVLPLAMAWTSHARSQGQSAAPSSTPTAVPPEAVAVGAAVCASCHADQHEHWRAGRHSKMLQPAGPSSVVGDFSRSALTLRGKPFRLREKDGVFYITESMLTGRPQEHRIDYTLGSRRIQHYLTTIDRGRIIVMTPTWDVGRREWFDNVDIVRPDEDDKTIVQQWNRHCVGCHVSEQKNGYNPATKTYGTTFVDFGTSCERCHGPGSAHVERYRASPASRAIDDRAIVRPTRLDPQSNSAVCAQCHSYRSVVAPGFRAGARYDDHFAPRLEYLPRKDQDPAYWADGRPRRFSNDGIGLWQSQCFLKGGATCTTCHDPHRPDVDTHPELAPASNTLCTQCHQDIGREVSAHTRHQAGSAGSACVECHMPRAVMSIKAKIRDHTMSLPTPENTVAFGIPNACTDCHAKQPAAWAAGVLKAWWPRGRRSTYVERATTFTAARQKRPEALEGLLRIAGDEAQVPLVRANALGYLRDYDDPRAESALVKALQAGQPTMRMVAASSLGRATAQPALLAALDDTSRSVRVAALLSLVNVGGGPFSGDDQVRFKRVSAEFVTQARQREDDADTQADLGLVHMLNGDLGLAERALGMSVGLTPGPKATFLLGLVRMGQGRPAEARALFTQIPASDAYYRVAQDWLKKTSPKP